MNSKMIAKRMIRAAEERIDEYWLENCREFLLDNGFTYDGCTSGGRLYYYSKKVNGLCLTARIFAYKHEVHVYFEDIEGQQPECYELLSSNMEGIGGHPEDAIEDARSKMLKGYDEAIRNKDSELAEINNKIDELTEKSAKIEENRNRCVRGREQVRGVFDSL